jgi:site-specific recombinase XerD
MAIRNRNGVWHYRFKLDGRQYSGSTRLAATRRNESKAKDIEAGHRLDLLEGRSHTRRILVREFSDAAKEFLEWVEVEHREHPNSSKRIVTSFASAKEFFGRSPVSTIDEGRIESFKTWRVTEHKVRDITLRHDLHALSKFFGFAVKQHWTRDNPIRRVDIPSDADAIRMHILTPTEERLYFNYAAKQSDLHDLGRLILNQGMRPDEVVRLAKENVDIERGQVQVPGGKTPAARRTLDLVTESRMILAKRMAGTSPWLFPSKRNPGQHITRLNSAHERVCEKAKKAKISFDFVLYDFRHTFATRMAQAGIDLATLAAILGHNSLRIVQKYIHPTAEHKREAMARYEETLKATQATGRTN